MVAFQILTTRIMTIVLLIKNMEDGKHAEDLGKQGTILWMQKTNI